MWIPENPLELELQKFVSHRMLGTELWSSTRIVCPVNYWTISLDPILIFLMSFLRKLEPDDPMNLK